MRWLLALLLVSGGAAHAARIAFVDAAGKIVALNGELRAGDETFPVQGGVATMPRPADAQREVKLVSAGWWALPATVTADETQIRVWRTGQVHGKFTVPEGIEVPATFTAGVETAPQAVRTSPIPRGVKFDCVTTPKDKSFACEVPAETLDLIFRTNALTPQYRWDVSIPPAGKVDVGLLAWKRGGSLVLWLDRNSLKQAKDGVKAIVTSMVTASASATTARLSIPVAEAKFNDRGYVQLAPLAAGLYTVEIVAPGFAKKRLSPLEVYEGNESVLRKPLVLEPPLTIRIALTPERDARAHAWKVIFRRLPDVGAPMTGTTREIVADEHGSITVEGESPGRFRVSVGDADGNRLAEREFEVTSAGDATQTIEIAQHKVKGTVRLGDAPLRAEVIFGTRDGAERVALKANDEGQFEGALPHIGRWLVEVRSDSAEVTATKEVDVRKDETLEIRIADTTIEGVVVGASGDREPRARVHAVSGALGQWIVADEQGAFRIRGVSGAVKLLARGRGTPEESAAVSLELMEGQVVRGVKLQLRERRSMRGRITSAGQPLPGASVSAYPNVSGMVTRATTDLDGRFELTLRDDVTAATFIVASAGRTMAAFQQPVTRDPVTFDLDAAGGELIVRLPEESDRFAIFHNGARLGLQELFEWTDAHGRQLISASGDSIAVSDLARGIYRACAHLVSGAETCRDATLVPRGTVTIDLRE